VIDAVVHRLLEAEIGLDLDSVGASSLRAAVAARMAARGVRDPALYASLLESRDEREALVDAVVIPETWFFRDRVPFELLAERATPGLRVLSAPCSSGEEPYSIAMALLDAGLAPGGFRIDALDISAPLLARARAGI
jgi:chemotaxis protein methyltransferase WspC